MRITGSSLKVSISRSFSHIQAKPTNWLIGRLAGNPGVSHCSQYHGFYKGHEGVFEKSGRWVYLPNSLSGLGCIPGDQRYCPKDIRPQGQQGISPEVTVHGYNKRL